MSRTPKAYQNLAQGGGLAEPWILAVKRRVALKERKNRRTQSNKGRAIFEDDDKLRRRGFSAAPSERSAFNVEYPGFRRASALAKFLKALQALSLRLPTGENDFSYASARFYSLMDIAKVLGVDRRNRLGESRSDNILIDKLGDLI